MKTEYEVMCDGLLLGEVFEGEDALTYCARGFADPELSQLDKEDLTSLLGKAFVVMCLHERKLAELNHKLSLAWGEKIEILSKVDQYKIEMFTKGFKYSKRVRAKINNKKSHLETNNIKKEIQDHFKLHKQTMFAGKKVEAYKYYEKQYPIKYGTIKNYLTNL